MDHVAGYCLINDVSEREYQTERGGQWDKGKGCDSFAPVGPWLVTRDEVADPAGTDIMDRSEWRAPSGRFDQDHDLRRAAPWSAISAIS